MKYLVVIASILILSFHSLWAQQGFQEQLVVPLSDPGKPGLLDVSLLNGNLTVLAYNGKEVIIRANGSGENGEKEEERRDGLRRIANNSLQLEAVQDDNKVRVHTNSHSTDVDLEIQVPKEFALKLKVVHGGDILVKGVEGEMEIENIHGDLEMKNVSGSAVLNTIHGDMEVVFDKVDPGATMAFSALHGDLDITFPKSVKATLKLQSIRGEIFTDFDLKVKDRKPKAEKSNDNGVYRVKLEDWVLGDINGGGPEYLFKTHHGDILIRSK